MKRIEPLNSRCSSPQQMDDLRLHGDVERRRRLVGDQQLGIAQQAHGDGDPLAHAAAELVRVLIRAAARHRECRRDAAAPTALRRLSAALPDRSRYWMSIICAPIDSTGFSAVIGSWNTMEMRRPRRSRSSRGVQLQHVAAVEQSTRPPRDRRVVRQQADGRQSQGRFSGAALADDADDAAARNGQADIAQRMDRPARRTGNRWRDSRSGAGRSRRPSDACAAAWDRACRAGTRRGR